MLIYKDKINAQGGRYHIISISPNITPHDSNIYNYCLLIEKSMMITDMKLEGRLVGKRKGIIRSETVMS